MTEARPAISSSGLRAVLSAYGPAPFSWLHPAAHLLFAERLTLRSWTTEAFGALLLGETSDGALFLPLPPPFFFGSDLTARSRGLLLENLFSRLSEESGGRVPPFLENCPLGALPSGSFRIEPSEREYLVVASSLGDLSGRGGRSLRWEENRFRRDHPGARTRPVTSGDLPGLRELSEAFVRRRQEVARSEVEGLLAADLGRSFERAIALGKEGFLEGWVLEEPGRILGLQWYGRSPDGKILVCFLEARGEGVSNPGSLMTREVVRTAGAGVRYVNLMGASGVAGVERAKRQRPHDLVLPLFRIRPP